jgi:transketolase
MISSRDAYRQELTQLAESDQAILCLESDLGGTSHPFQKSHPSRFFNLGIAEASMIDMAAALGSAGFKPFISTFAPFAAHRAAESIKLSMGYLGANVKLIAPYGGVSGAWFGPTHHALEDLAVVQSIPGIRLAAPYGEMETRWVIQEALSNFLPYYIRLGRNGVHASFSSREDVLNQKIVWQFPRNSYKSNRAAICLVSIGETATDYCVRVMNHFRTTNDVTHAHLCFFDYEKLLIYCEEIKSAADCFIVVEEHRQPGSIGSTLATLMPDRYVIGFNCSQEWASLGGTHSEILSHLGFSLEGLFKMISKMLQNGHSEFYRC